MKKTCSTTGHSKEAGYTLIELLFVIVIIGILASISIATFKLYRDNAEYSKAFATLRNAQTAITVADLDLPDGSAVAYSATTPGANATGQLAQILPGASNSSGVRLGAAFTSCDDSSGPFDVNMLVVAQPCLGSREVRWQRFCGGTELLQENIAFAGCS